MSIFDFLKKNDSDDHSEDYSTGFSKQEIPSKPDIPLNKGRTPYVEFGANNTFPLLLRKLYRDSPVNCSIINKVAMMVTGGGFTQEENLTELQEQLYNIKDKVSLDFKLYGAFSMVVFWSADKTRITKVKHIDAGDVRSGYYEGGKVITYYYSRDWTDKRQPVIEYDSYDPNNINEFKQLLYVSNESIGIDYYGFPKWYSAAEWINIDDGFADLFNNEIENGFSPSLAVRFYSSPPPEKRREITRKLNRQYAGKNAEKVITLFSKNKDLDTSFDPINKGSIDSQWKVINDLAIGQILTAHGVTSPLLFGIKTAGQLGGGNELDVAYRIFLNTEVKPIQSKIENVFNSLLEVNNEGEIEFNNYDLLV